MARIAPFRGIRYDAARAGRLDDVVAPPYDVISPRQREDLVARSPHNIVAVDLPAGDDDARYERAAATWRTWRADGVLRPEAEPALYLVEEKFDLPTGARRVRRGFVASLTLENLGADTVAPHERTFAGPKADRLKLTRATRANLSAVFMLYRDPARRLDAAWDAIARRAPDAAASAPDGDRRMWCIADERSLALAREVLAASSLTIADGHHRYETALAYRAECRSRGETGGAESLMVFLSSMDDPDLTILPSHRVVRFAQGFDVAGFLHRLADQFDMEPVDGDGAGSALAAELAREGAPHGFAFFSRERGWLRARLRSWDAIAPWIDPRRANAWRRLDVSVLHEFVLGALAGRTSGDAETVGGISYTIDPAEGETAVRSGAADLCCLVRPTTTRDIDAVVRAGDTMPHKSTYFYPKLLTGLVMRSFDED